MSITTRYNLLINLHKVQVRHDKTILSYNHKSLIKETTKYLFLKPEKAEAKVRLQCNEVTKYMVVKRREIFTSNYIKY